MCSILSNNRWYTGIYSKSPVRIMHNRSIVIRRVLKFTCRTFGKLTLISVYYVTPIDGDVVISITSRLLVLVTFRNKKINITSYCLILVVIILQIVKLKRITSTGTYCVHDLMNWSADCICTTSP